MIRCLDCGRILTEQEILWTNRIDKYDEDVVDVRVKRRCQHCYGETVTQDEPKSDKQ